MVRLKVVPGLFRAHSQNGDHECSHQEATVGLLVELIVAVVVDLNFGKLRVLNNLCLQMFSLTTNSLTSSRMYLWVLARFKGPKSLWKGS